MARTKKPKQYFYVLVLPAIKSGVPRFVTSYEVYPHRFCYWKANTKPCDLGSLEDAQYMCTGLAWSGHVALPVVLNYELDMQLFKEDEEKEAPND